MFNLPFLQLEYALQAWLYRMYLLPVLFLICNVRFGFINFEH
jgi:hypothetical protein